MARFTWAEHRLQPPRRVRSSWPSLLFLTALAGTAGAVPRATVRGLFPGGRGTVHVGPSPRGLASTAARRCADCHADIAAEWRASMHASSWSDPVFRTAYAVEPMAFCRNCHAPTHTGTVPAGLAADDGVSCEVCHVRGGHVLAASASTRAPHAMQVVAGLRSSAHCAGCHQFDFPGDAGRAGVRFDTHEPMQDTFAEWRDSAAGRNGTPCQDCHMPWVDGPDGARHRSHRFPGGRDLALLRSAVAVDVSARRESAGTRVTFTVTSRALGHSFPTGDLFRRAELTASWDDDAASAVRAGLARSFADVPTSVPGATLTFLRRQVGDTRLPAAGLGAPVTVSVLLPGPPRAAPIRWSFDHLLMPTPLAASQGVGEPRNRLVVLTGAVVPPSPEGASP